MMAEPRLKGLAKELIQELPRINFRIELFYFLPVVISVKLMEFLDHIF